MFANSELASVYGKVGMKGQIYYSACTIDTQSLDQTINMGNTPIHELLEQGAGPSIFFSIRLIDCDFGQNPNGIKGDLGITFDGLSEGNFFMVSGDASGIGLAIYNDAQVMIMPGVATSLSNHNIHLNDNIASLIYRIQLVKIGSTMSSGNYNATLNFKIDYN